MKGKLLYPSSEAQPFCSGQRVGAGIGSGARLELKAPVTRARNVPAISAKGLR